MKKSILFSASIALLSTIANAQVGINTNTPNSQSFLHIFEGPDATKQFKGTIVSRYSTTERDTKFGTLDQSHDGMLIYNKDTHCYNYYKYVTATNKGWKEICDKSNSTGIFATNLGVPIIVKLTSGGHMQPNQIASSISDIKNLLAKDDWLQLDFGNAASSSSTTLFLRINNVSDGSISLSGTSYSINSNAGDPNTPKSYTISAGGGTPWSIDPYITGGFVPANSFGFTASAVETVVYMFTATKGTETRNYVAVWTAYAQHEAATNGAIRTELYQYNN